MSLSCNRRIIILHGLSADSRSDWYSNVAGRFRSQGCDVLVPNLPGSYAPNLNRWTKAIHQAIEQQSWPIDEHLSLIGHSTGVMAAMRFVEGISPETRLGPCIFVAGFPAALFHSKIPVFVARPPRPKMIQPKIPRLLAVHSTNDWRVPIGPNSAWLESELRAEICTIKNGGHFIRRHGWTDWSEELYERALPFIMHEPAQ